jgi:PAS domain-containing protein
MGILAELCPDYGIWTDHRIPDDRSDWHPMVRSFYEYWLAAAPPGRLPGRQHIAPEDLVPCLPRVWLLEVHRDPLRLRFRLAGTQVAWSVGSDPTGQWLEEVHPDGVLKPTAMDRYRFAVETGKPTWRRGRSVWNRDPRHHSLENCHAPLARDGETVDMIFCLTVLFDARGQEINP